LNKLKKLNVLEITYHIRQTTFVQSNKTQDYFSQLNPLKTKRRLLYLKTQSVPRCKHFPPRL